MHNLSIATGLALGRLITDLELEDTSNPLVNEIAAFVERARVNLKLDSTILANAVMFAQPLVTEWKPKWKFAYTVALSLSCKLDLDGFYIQDIIDHVTAEFPLRALKVAERMAFENFEKGMAYQTQELRERRLLFRNALILVALESPLPGGTAAVPLRCPGEEAPPPPHVLVVDDSRRVREHHRSLVLACSPEATIRMAASAAEAIEICRHCDEMNEPQLNLVLLDLNLSEAETESSHALREIIGDPKSGFEVAGNLKTAEGSEPSKFNMHCRPLVAMVTSYAEQVVQLLPQRADGSVEACDVLLKKPLNSSQLRVLLEACMV